MIINDNVKAIKSHYRLTSEGMINEAKLEESRQQILFGSKPERPIPSHLSISGVYEAA